jgi:ABC-type transporter Mla maintaining outer membrane lipid asymmetry ATPase subunit MlaF
MTNWMACRQSQTGGAALEREEGHVKTVGSTPLARGEVRCERRADDETLLVRLVGRWTTRAGAPVVTEVYQQLDASPAVRRLAFELALVGLAGFEDFYPSEISGGMRKRAGLARAMALDPDILFFDEPSAGLDPLSSRRLDDLILELRDSLGATVVVVTHELASIFTIGDNGVFLDADTKTMLAVGNPKTLRDTSSEPKICAFLKRGEADAPPAA